MNHTYRRLTHILLSLLILTSLLLSSCGTLIPSADPVTISFSFSQDDQAYFESLLPAFNEKYPYITVELEPYSDEPNYESDVVTVSWMATIDTTELFENTLPLDSFISEQQDFSPGDFYPGTLDAFANEGKQYAVPLGVDPWMVYYNKDLFDRYGAAYPQPGWDWTDFLDRALSLRDPENAIYGFASMNNHVEALLFIYQHGGSLTQGTTPTLNTDINIEAIRWYVGLYREFNVAPTQEQISTDLGARGGGVYFGMLNGKVAMFSMPLSMHSGQRQGMPAWTFNWGVVPFPHDETSFTISFVDGLAISKQSAEPEAAWKWISHVTNQPHNRLLPARIPLAESSEYAELVGDEVAEAGRQSMQSVLVTSRQNVNNFMGIIDLFSITIDSLVNNDLIVQEEMDKAQILAEMNAP
jgi:multiple sugar transport system substrate-binding protein